ASPVPSAESAQEARRPDDPFAQFAVFDVESELVYDSDYEAPSAGTALGPVDPNKLAVSRTVLYAQGALLGLVALFSFAIGVMVGLGAAGDTDGPDQPPQPCLIEGTAVVQVDGGEARPDIGAVAIVLPRDFHPDRKAEIVGLRPQDPLPGDNHEGLRTIKSIGGDYVRADDQGRFQLRVPDRGNYFLLVISASASRPDGEQPKSVLAQIGRFFQLTPNLFEGHAYRWREEIVRRDRELSIVFP
ncbi:MAG: hypothetical protein JJ992_05100, partial [Planctomycetes bacterium]|nr:hypothetical protein [Planctomycetota bacterium]